MKIGSKIALFYTLLSVLTTIIIIAVFYLFSTQFINKPVSYTHLDVYKRQVVGKIRFIPILL